MMLKNQNSRDVKTTRTTNLREKGLQKQLSRKASLENPQEKRFLKKKPLKSQSKAKRVKTEKSVNKPQKLASISNMKI